MKILLTRSLLDVDRKYIDDGLSAFIGGQFQILIPETYDEEGLCKLIQDADVLLGPFITEKMLAKAERLKLIQIPWAGLDSLNFDAVRNSQIGESVMVCNSHSNAAVVAEFGVGLVLDLIKKISYHDRKMRRGNWNRDQQPLNLKSAILANQTVCILGYGNIGRRMGKLLSAFGTKVIAVANKRHGYPEVYKLYESSRLIEAVSQADICVCTLPLIPHTKGLINKETIGKMKKGCLFVNMSRADIVIEDDMYSALVEGTVAGFASDVWWNKPVRGASESFVSTHNKFEELENVILSPHRAGFVEGLLPHLDDAIINIINLALGKKLINIVDLNARY